MKVIPKVQNTTLTISLENTNEIEHMAHIIRTYLRNVSKKGGSDPEMKKLLATLEYDLPE